MVTLPAQSPLVIVRSVRIQCDYAASALVPVVPPAPRSWDTSGGVGRAGAPAAQPQNATAPGALSDGCVIESGGASQLLVVPASAPANLRVNITNVVLRRGAAGAANGGALALQATRTLVVLDHVTLADNSAQNGGAIFITGGSALVALGCRFTDNVRWLPCNVRCTTADGSIPSAERRRRGRRHLRRRLRGARVGALLVRRQHRHRCAVLHSSLLVRYGR